MDIRFSFVFISLEKWGMDMDENEKIFVEERRERILAMLAKQKRVTIAELSKTFNLGEATIRRDLNEMEARGLILRTHGGAIPADNAAEEVAFKVRENRNKDEKERIARFISQIVRNGETLMLDGGSTTLAIVHALKTKNNLVLVTNSPLLANEMVGVNGSQVILTGGELQDKTYVTVGPVAEHTLSQFRADRVIVGMSAMMPDEGFFTVNHYEAEIKRAMIKSGKEVIVAMDSSKVGKITFSFVTDFSHIDKLIIDDGVSPEIIEKIEKQGVEVIVV